MSSLLALCMVQAPMTSRFREFRPGNGLTLRRLEQTARKAAQRRRDLNKSGESAVGYIRHCVVGARTRDLYLQVAAPLCAACS